MRNSKHRPDDWLWPVTKPGTVWEVLLAGGVSKALAAQLAKEKCLLVDGKRVDTRTELQGGETLCLRMPREALDHEPVEMDLTVLYEDEDCLVIDKPAGITVHSAGQVSLANGIAYLFQERKLHRKVRFVNRLDRDTSGCLLVAKSALAHQFLQRQMEDHTMEKWYEAVVDGTLTGEGICELTIGRAADGIHQEVRADGKLTKTLYQALEPCLGGQATRVRLQLLTGKTHQIRVTMAYLGHPLTGDTLYGGSPIWPHFQLCAYELQFAKIRTGERCICNCQKTAIPL